MPKYEIKPHLQKKLVKLAKKDKKLYEQTLKKIDEIINSSSIEHYKNLSNTMKDQKRVHIGHFVLVFSYLKQEQKICFIDFNHHDNIYL